LIQSNPPLDWCFLPRNRRVVHKISVVGEVFPEGGKLSDESFLCNAKPKDTQQAAVCEKLVEDTLEPPDSGKLLGPQGRTSARVLNGSCRNLRQ
jgi:hypothetical protein